MRDGMATEGSPRDRTPNAQRPGAVAQPGTAAVLHPDPVIGGLAELLQVVANPVAN